MRFGVNLKTALTGDPLVQGFLLKAYRKCERAIKNELCRGRKCSGIPEAETFGQNRKFSAFGLRFRPPKLKAEYGRMSN